MTNLENRCRAIDELTTKPIDLRTGATGERRVAYYYCAGTKTGETRSSNSSELLLQSLIRQLARQHSTMAVAPAVWHEHKLSRNNRNVACPMSLETCIGLLEKLISPDPRVSHVTIVIDALDECDDRHDLLNVLYDLVKNRPQSVRLLLSSRHDVESPWSADDERVQIIKIDPINRDSDMRNFVEQTVNTYLTKFAWLKSILAKDKKMKLKVQEAVIERASGVSVAKAISLSIALKSFIADYVQVSVG